MSSSAEPRRPLSAAQREIWIAHHLDATGSLHTCGGYLEIDGPIDHALLENAVRRTVAECEPLRVRFGVDADEEPWQQVVAHEPALPYTDVSAQDDPHAAADRIMRADLARPVRLVQDGEDWQPLYQHHLFGLGGGRWLFALRYHHIVLDGYGQALYWRRLADTYTALTRGAEPAVCRWGSLADLLDEDEAYQTSADHTGDREHWLEACAGQAVSASLAGTTPVDGEAASGHSGLPVRPGPVHRTPLEPCADLRSATAAHGSHWSAVAAAATAAYVHRVAQVEDIVLGLPVRARTTRLSLTTPGMMANILPLRLTVTPRTSVGDLVAEASARLAEVLAHQRYRGEELRRELRRADGAGGEPPAVAVNLVTFDTALKFDQHPAAIFQLSSGPVQDLSLDVFGGVDGMVCRVAFEARPDAHSMDMLAAHHTRFGHYLQAVADADPDTLVDDIELLTEDERAALTEQARSTAADYDLSRRLHEIIEQQAAATPDAIAVATDDTSVTYRELLARARALAGTLAGHGVAAGDVVGVLDERSADLVVELLAVLLAGAAYLPLDPELPRARLLFQLQDSAATAVLTRSHFAGLLEDAAVPVIAVDTVQPAAAAGPLPVHTASPGDTAYVIYTSGSTGRPKGVAVPHRGVVNRLLWMQETFRIGPDDRILQKTAFTFDVSVWELFWPLISGAVLVMAAPGAHRDPRALAEAIGRHQVTTIHFVPSMLDLFLAEPAAADPAALRRVLCSGEALRPETVGEFFRRYGAAGPELHNLYGPTEASIDVTHWRCRPEDARGRVPIGRAVANTGLYVLDSAGRPLPFGVPGELCLAGVQLATGYLNRPELTAEAFPANAFAGQRIYRTGDLAVLRADGVAFYRGRIDHQVKVHGFRIEPGEIESALLARDGVTQAVVIAVGADGIDRRLAAYVTGDRPLEPEPLLAALRDQLPGYLVPAHLTVLDAFPTLPNGKLDRALLPVPAAAAGQAAPSTADEELLRRIWCEVLGIPDLGVDDSFFTLGGDSMRAIQVRARAERSGRTFEVADLLSGPTVRRLAARLRPAAGGQADERVPTAPFSLLGDADRALLPDGLDDAYPLSSMQAGILYHAAYSEHSAIYRVVTSVRVGGRLDLAVLQTALDDTARRHPSLRCSFDLAHFSEPLQLVHHDVSIPLETGEDLTGLTEPEQRQAVVDWVERAKFAHFELAEPPLLRFTVHPCAADSFELSVVEHHIVLDGWSDIRMLEEVVARYTAGLDGLAADLRPVRSSYRDFIAAEIRTLADDESRDFWAALVNGADGHHLPVHAAPGDGRPHENRRYDVPLPERVTDGLRELARREGLPLKSLLAAAHLAVLRLVSGRDEVTTGVIANARLEEEGGDEAIGVFLNTLPVRADLSDATLLDVGRAVFDHERAASAHRRYPFARMRGDGGGEAWLDSYVNFMDFHSDHGADLPMRVTVGVAETNYPLSVNFLVPPGGGPLQLWLDCDLATLSADFCDRLPGYYARALALVAQEPWTPAATADLLGADDRAAHARLNATAAAYDRAATIHSLIADQARSTPDATALVHRFEKLTYAELDRRANRLAQHLRVSGVGRGDLVGVALRRGTDLVVTLLAVMKAGAAYVPMDPAFPLSRLDHIAADCAIHCLVRGPGSPRDLTAPRTVDLTADAAAIAAAPEHAPDDAAGPRDSAYVIYTSGSTGRPKGTAIRHDSVVNLFAGIDERVGCDATDTLLAVTSVSFDISVLELLWPLTRGATVVVAGERVIENLAQQTETADKALSFSLFFFAAAAGSNRDGYRLVLDAARFADSHGFEAVWTPERHFHRFGGLYPNPSVLSAALATVTERIALRCGSVVSPLHDTVRMAEEWSLVDNLSGGRVGLAFAAGWNSNDFALKPENFARRKELMGEQIEDFRKLWRGEPFQRVGGSGELVDITIHPSPVQAEPPIWLTSVGTVATFEKAGASGANLLTHLLGQRPEELTEKIKAYRSARQQAGHQGPGQVTVMVHAFLAGDTEAARAKAREPFRAYLRSSTELWRTVFATTGRDLPELGAEEQIDAVIAMAIDRYFETSGLFGTPESCADMLRTLAGAGADEVACLVDFGLPTADVLESLTWLDRLRENHEAEVGESRHSFAELCGRHRVTMVQGTPSLLTAIAAEPAALDALRSARTLMIGGEAFPAGLADRLLDALPGVRIHNMYGPTETTVWSTCHELTGRSGPAGRDGAESVPIGRPIANTRVLVADPHGRPAPIGVPGELWIGGDGVATGYLGRPELTAERFVTGPGPGSGTGPGDGEAGEGTDRYYRTGDRVRLGADGELEFVGRLDRQIKILGHRVEPDEVESVLSRHPELGQVAVTVVDNGHGSELVAYLAPAQAAGNAGVQEAHVRRWSEVWEEAYTRDPGQDPGPDSGPEAAGRERPEFAGWLSSYTGEPIPEPQMRAWLGHTLDRIRALRPNAVADIGVGVGLVLRGLYAEVGEYHGVDISPAALAAAAGCLGPGKPLPGYVRLSQAGPEYLAGLAPGSLDTVILNSVVQYFPSADYLRGVLRDALRAVRPGGAVFIGDVRSVGMLPEFHTSVQLHRAQPLATVAEIRSTIARSLRDERELCLSPSFFHDLAAEPGTVAQVRIELKRGRYDNELTRFRYDVALIAGPPAPTPAPRRTAWAGADALRALLAELPDHEPLLVSAVPNRRLVRDAAAVRALAEADAQATAWDLERVLWETDPEPVPHPEDLIELGTAAGRAVTTKVAPDGRLETYDALFGPADRATDDHEVKR